MNPIVTKVVMAGFLLSMVWGLYYLIGENAKLEKDNENLVSSIKDHEVAVESLAGIVTDLSEKYSEATNDEFKKFNKSDINKIPMDRLVRSYNVGVKRVFRDYKSRTSEFIRGSTKTTSPPN